MHSACLQALLLDAVKAAGAVKAGHALMLVRQDMADCKMHCQTAKLSGIMLKGRDAPDHLAKVS